MAGNTLLLFTSKRSCLQTSHYDESHPMMKCNINTKFESNILLSFWVMEVEEGEGEGEGEGEDEQFCLS